MINSDNNMSNNNVSTLHSSSGTKGASDNKDNKLSKDNCYDENKNG